MGAGRLRVSELMLLSNRAILCAIHRGLLLKSLKAFWANPHGEYTLGNILNEYHAAKETRGGAAGRRRLQRCVAVMVERGASKPAPSPAARVRHP
jgi:hypothetical protein